MKHDSTAYSAIQAPQGERADCSVRALAIAAGMSYADAYQAFKEAGREDGKRTSWAVSCRLYERLGFCRHETRTCRYDGRRIAASYMTVAQLIRGHPKGRFILNRRGHAFALIDGVVHDWASGTGPRSRVRAAWKITR
jgi:hypothetical protein